jgi:histidyl-tRNA synthetase
MGALDQRLSELKVLLQELENLGIRDWVTLDLTIVRGLAYYTGFVFEVFESGDQGRALAGGGRYDHLFEKLVGQPMPAVGFAAGDVTLTDLLRKQTLFPPYKSAVDCYVVFESTERQRALLLAQQLRAAGFSVLYSLDLQKDLGKQQKKAYADDPHYVITLTHELVSQAKAQIKGVESEEIVDLKSLPEYLKQ